jgi:dihydroflavonol-4-reductase
MEARGLKLSQSTVAVTGATGFLGRYMVKGLLARRARVIGVVRDPDRATDLAEMGVELRRASLDDRDSLARGFDGADAVISNAALLSLGPTRWKDYLSTNVMGTANVYDAMAACGTRRAIQLSSVGVYRNPTRPTDENHPLHSDRRFLSHLNAYGVSKALSERRAWKKADEHGIQLTTLRPAGIYGAFDTNLTRFHKLLMACLPLTLYPCVIRFCMVYAGDVAEAALLSLEGEISVSKAYNVVGEDHSTWEFGSVWKRLAGRAPLLRVPIPVPYRRLYSNQRIKRDLGWRSRPYEEGIRELLETEAAASQA